MVRIRLVLLFCAGSVLVGGVARAQCRGGMTGQGTTGTTGTTTAALAGLAGGFGTGSQLFSGPGSYTQQIMMSQLMAQQMAQQRYMLAMQQEQLKQEKLAERRGRAEQNRAKVAESRARARAALAAQSGVASPNAHSASLVSYQARR